MSHYRVVSGHHPQNVYRGDRHIGVMFTGDDAELVVAALNRENELLEAVEAALGPAAAVDVAEQLRRRPVTWCGLHSGDPDDGTIAARWNRGIVCALLPDCPDDHKQYVLDAIRAASLGRPYGRPE